MNRPLWLASCCAAALVLWACTFAQRAKADGTVRVMSYNIQWFSEDADAERITNLKTLLSEIKPDVVALQEIQSKKALQQIFDSSWQIEMNDDPKEYQELAVAVRSPLKVVKSEMLFKTPALEYGVPGDRDVLRVEVQAPSGQTFSVYSVHWKSRRGGRLQTDGQRRMGAGLLAAFLAAKPEEKSIVMGDFNDAPDDYSANILESGNLMAPGGTYSVEKPLMINLVEQLYRNDGVTIDLHRKWLGDPLEARVEGAYKDNERLRGKEYKFPDDVEVTQALFDQILVSAGLKSMVVGSASIYSKNPALRGTDGRTSRNDETGVVTYQVKGSRASDHLPVFADLRL